MPKLVLITNPDSGSPEEDVLLSEKLTASFDVSIEHIQHLPSMNEVDVALLRNAWPSRLFEEHLGALAMVSGVMRYNPPHRGSYVEDKSYLIRLMDEGYPVIPTFLDPSAVPGEDSRILAKPIDGCSSYGVEVMERSELPGAFASKMIFQPWLKLVEEVSYYFIDDQFAYALRTGGRERWDLELYAPPGQEIEWAKRFVTWGRMPYGLQRIDAGRLIGGELRLMEIEDTMPFLSLECLSVPVIDQIVKQLVESIHRQLAFPPSAT